MRGELVESEDPDSLRWQSPNFRESFEIPLMNLDAVRFAKESPRRQPAGRFAAELINDDIVYGDLIEFTSEGVSFDVAKLGPLRIPSGQIRRLYQWRDRKRGIELKTVGEAAWQDSSQPARWVDLMGLPNTNDRGATIFGDFGLPPQAAIEFHLSWKGRPDFVFAIGVNRTSDAADQMFSFEVWDSDIVVVGESRRDADFATLQAVRTGPGELRVRAYIDQIQRKLFVYSQRGQRLAEIKIRHSKKRPRPGLRLTNGNGDLQLDSLRVMSWDGAAPDPVQTSLPRLHRADGSVVYGTVISYDRDAKEMTVESGQRLERISADSVTDIYLSTEPAEFIAADAKDKLVRLNAIYEDGTRLSGVPIKFGSDHLVVQTEASRAPLRLPLSGLRSLIAFGQGELPNTPTRIGRAGRLEMDGVSLLGRLVGSQSDTAGSCLAWHPNASRNGSPFVFGVAGRIDLQSRPKRMGRARRRSRLGSGKLNPNATLPEDKWTPAPRREPERLVHLRTGDTIPATVGQIDDAGLKLTTPLTETTFIPHAAIKAVELGGTPRLLDLGQKEQEQLLTLPRLKRNRPPTHLICSRDADFLRGRIIQMDERQLTLQVRLEARVIPRDRIAYIIWLHDDELESSSQPPPEASRPERLRLQAIQENGRRLTFAAEHLEGELLSGRSAVLGDCQVDLSRVEQLLLGSHIEKAAPTLAFHDWSLHHATDPKFIQHAADAATRPWGTESPLVGKLAPDFLLEMLGGGEFHLAELRGQIVILDFWATWCEPCLETMPLVEGVASEYTAEGVRLVTVNLEQHPQQIKSMFTQHQLTMKVALDRDGSVGSRYLVEAIPQTVVIDRTGHVARLFVGGGAKIAGALKAAIDELIER